MNHDLIPFVESLGIASASLGVLALLGVLFAKHLSPRGQVLFWMFVVARGLLLFSGSYFARTFPAYQGVVRRVSLENTAQIESATATSPWWNIVLQQTEALAFGAIVLWAIGALVLIAVACLGHLRFLRSLRNATTITNPALQTLLEEAQDTVGVDCHIEFLESSSVKSPAIFGFLRPCLLLPPKLTEEFSSHEMRHVLLHELCHVKHRDALINSVALFALALHWFNPLAWLAYRNLRLAQERRCDASTCAILGEKQRPLYAQTLVRLLEKFSFEAPEPGVALFAENPKEVRGRLLMIFSNGSVPAWRRVLLATAGVLTCIACASTTLAGAPRAPQEAARHPSMRMSVAKGLEPTGPQLEVKLGVDISQQKGDHKLIRNAKTSFRINSGDTMLIGGLYTDRNAANTSNAAESKPGANEVRVKVTSQNDGTSPQGLARLDVVYTDAKGEVLAAPSMTVRFGEEATFEEKFGDETGKGEKRIFSLRATVTKADVKEEKGADAPR